MTDEVIASGERPVHPGGLVLDDRAHRHLYLANATHLRTGDDAFRTPPSLLLLAPNAVLWPAQLLAARALPQRHDTASVGAR